MMLGWFVGLLVAMVIIFALAAMGIYIGFVGGFIVGAICTMGGMALLDN